MAARVSATSGFDLGYVWRNMGGEPERTAGGYYINAAQAGEAPGRWFGAGAEALGLAEGSVVERGVYDQVYKQINLLTGEKMGRAPGGYAKFADHLASLEAAEPHATWERHLELERIAAQQTRRSPAYTDVLVSFDKTISIMHASIRENERRARLAGDAEAEAYWRDREAKWQEILQEATRRGLEYLHEQAGYTRTGYHGRRVEGVEPGKWERALPIVSVWLQGTTRDGSPHDHLHCQHARMAITESDRKARALDTVAMRAHLPGMTAVVNAYVESALTREFGVEWVPRDDGFGNEISGIRHAWKESFSTRTQTVTRRGRELARKWEAKFGREPNTREMTFILHEARDHTRKAKAEGEIDWDKLAEEWDGRIGGELAGIAPSVFGVSDKSGTEKRGDIDLEAEAVRGALARVQREHSTWTKADLLKHLSWAMGPEFSALDPDARQKRLFAMADRATSAAEGVRCLEAPEWPPLPQQLRRDLDGRSVFTRPGTARYATRGHLGMEDALVERAGRQGAPRLTREDAARLLGADASVLEAMLAGDASDHAKLTRTGLRHDQAASIFAAQTTGRRVALTVGPPGSGKSHALGEGTRAWEASGRKVIGITCSQAARDVLVKAGVKNSWNSTKWLSAMDYHDIRLAPGTMIIIDEATTLPLHHWARIVQIAERDDCLVWAAGDPAQLDAVEGPGGMRLLADSIGHTTLAHPVRFSASWEQQASLRLRDGDQAVLDIYDEHGRIVGGDRDQVFTDLRQAYVAARLAGEETILMAYSREDCRELSRQIRDDLVHLGLVDSGRSARLAEGARASAGDMIVCGDNDHKVRMDGGHALTNGDVYKVEEVADRGLVVRRVLDPDKATGQVRLSQQVLYPARNLDDADLAYAVTGHKGQGGTFDTARSLVTGAEPREWITVAMTRGRHYNAGHVVTRQRAADPAPGTRPDPELDRHDRVMRERDGLEPEPVTKETDLREPIAVLADCMDRTEAEVAAITYQKQALLRADHLGMLHTQYADLTKNAERARYGRIVMDALPEQYRQELSPAATWLWRSLQATETCGLDPEEVVRTAVNSRTLTGIRDMASVLDARIRAMVDPLVPLPQRPWSERVPEVADPEINEYVRELAAAMDARKERLGQFALESQPDWAVNALGPAPEHPVDRLDYAERASRIAAHRELFGIEDEIDVIGPEPAGSSPEQRASWFSAFAAINRTDELDVRDLPDSSLWHMRDTYKDEIGWAPVHVGRQLRAVRIGAEEARLRAIRSDAEARVARDGEVADRHSTAAESARIMERLYRSAEVELAATQADRDTWEKLTRGSRHLAVEADTELRKRHPDKTIERLKSAEPRVPEEAELVDAETKQSPGWISTLAEQRAEFRARLEERQGLMVPDSDPDYGDVGEAWPQWKPEGRKILEPPKPELRPAPELERVGDREMGN
jgi:AAA domain/TrwC relaxase